MKTSLRFIVNFFRESQWVDAYRPHFTGNNEWYNAYEVRCLENTVEGHTKGSVVIKVLTDRLYVLFQKYCRAKCPSCRVVQESTFHQQVACLGIKPLMRQRFRDTKRDICKIYFSDVQKGIKKKFPGYVLHSWSVCNTDERNELIRKLP